MNSPHGHNNLIGILCKITVFSVLRQKAIFSGVSVVHCVGGPLKVFCGIVALVAINVVDAFRPFRSWRKERKRDSLMNIHSAKAPTQIDPPIPGASLAFGHDAPLKTCNSTVRVYRVSRHTSYASQRGNLKSALVPRNVAPLFVFHDNPLAASM